MPDGARQIIVIEKHEPLIIHEDQLLRIDRVTLLTGLSRAAIYEMAGEGRFPMAVQLTGTAVAWRASEVLEWIRTRPRAKLRRTKPELGGSRGTDAG